MQTCKKCVLNSNDSIHFKINEDTGVCNFCEDFEFKWRARPSAELRKQKLSNLVSEIKQQKGKYNCLLGLSGGVDSSYLAWWAKEQGLKPLVVHLDNGWNSELAVQNIHSICDLLDYDLKTIVINWEEFKQLQLSYLKAGVVDIEALTDHAIHATVQRLTKKYGLKFILSGHNLATEGIMPKDWVHSKTDWTNIKDIIKNNDGPKIKTFPKVNFCQNLWNYYFNKLKVVQPLDLMEYNKVEAKILLIDKLNWRDYGGKHYESVFTKFYQAYILPIKFGIDKRKAHLSTLIGSGQLSKKAAQEELKTPLYLDEELQDDMDYFLKKMNLSLEVFNEVMSNEPVPHTRYKTDKYLWESYFRLLRVIKFWR